MVRNSRRDLKRRSDSCEDNVRVSKTVRAGTCVTNSSSVGKNSVEQRSSSRATKANARRQNVNSKLTAINGRGKRKLMVNHTKLTGSDSDNMTQTSTARSKTKNKKKAKGHRVNRHLSDSDKPQPSATINYASSSDESDSDNREEQTVRPRLRTVNKTLRKQNKRVAGIKLSKPSATVSYVSSSDEVVSEPVIEQKRAKQHSSADKKRANRKQSRAIQPKRSRKTSKQNRILSESESSESEDDTRVRDQRTGARPQLRIPTYETESESDVEQFNTVDDHIDSLSTNIHLGQSTGGQSDLELSEHNIYAEPVATPISLQIDPKIQRKIWKHKFIDLASLLPTYGASPSNRNYSLQLGRDSTFNLVPSHKLRKIFNISQWTTAFLRFVAIYAEKFPKETPQLMKYAEVIRDLASRRPGLGWYHYDIQFRQMRQMIKLRWDKLHTELWLTSATASQIQSPAFQSSTFQRPAYRQPFRRYQSQPPSHRTDQPTFLRYSCWSYNRSGSCTRTDCKFTHTCGKCRGPRSANNCRGQSAGHSNPNRPQQENSTGHARQTLNNPIPKPKPGT